VSRTIIIGDVHGMAHVLTDLWGVISPQHDDEVVFAGDLLDKGPDPVGVVRFVYEKSLTHRVVLVEGNHEEKHRRFRKHLHADPKGRIPIMIGAHEMMEVYSKLTADEIAFLDAAVPYHRTQYGDLVVHGGIPRDVMDISSKRAHQELIRTRFIHPVTGKRVKLEDSTPHDVFWAEAYDGRFGKVYFGHHPFMGGVGRFPHAVGLDTGAVFGGGLTAAVCRDTCAEYITVGCSNGTQ
jgi:serine/threonine protein phosphatase 1